MSKPKCQPLFSTALEEVRSRVRSAPRIAVFLDFDGTLAPIVSDPSAAQIDDDTRDTVAALAVRCRVTIISGRSVDDVRQRVAMRDLIYAGNHGLEISGPDIYFVQPFAAATQMRLQRLSTDLSTGLARFPGVLVEYKGLTSSVHLRQAAEEDLAEIGNAVRQALEPCSEQFRLALGHMVLEIRPRILWDKGTAVQWILRCGDGGDYLPIYIGDDRTDEDAFRVLPDGITVRVGECTETAARYCLADPRAVREFLKRLSEDIQ